MTGASPVTDAAATGPAIAAGRFQHAFWFCLLLAVALVLAGASMAVGAYTAAAAPDTVVRQYFAALQSGDAAAALGYGHVPSGPPGLLSPSVLAVQNEIGPIQNVAIRRIERSGDTASVGVTYTLGFGSGPVNVADTMRVVRSGRGWRLAQSAVIENIIPGNGSGLANVAGSAVPTGTYLMFPGAVPVAYDTPNLTLAASSRVIRFDDGGSLNVVASVSAEGRAAITPAVVAELSSCLAGRSATQPLCPLPDEAAGVPGTLRGKESGPMHLTFRVDDPGGQINIGGSAPVSASYRALDSNNIEGVKNAQSTRLSAFCDPTKPTIVWWAR